MIKKMNKKNLLPVLVALFAFGVQTQNVVAGSSETSSPAGLNTGSLSALLNKYAVLSHSERDRLRESQEYKTVIGAVKALIALEIKIMPTENEIMQRDLTQMLPAMENFMRNVPDTRDDFAHVIDDLYWKVHYYRDELNVTKFLDKSNTDSLKNSFNIMNKLCKDDYSYKWVKRFCQAISKSLLTFIVEDKDGAEFASKAIKDGKLSLSDLSDNAKSKVKDFEKKAESNAAAEKITAVKNAETEIKSSTMDQLAETYAKEYVSYNFSEAEKVRCIFDQKMIEEKGKLNDVYKIKTFKELMELQDELYRKIKNSDYAAKGLHTKWFNAQVEGVGEVLLSKLLSEPEYVEELARRNNVYGRVGFYNKLNNFVTNNRSKFRDYYTKEYRGKPYSDLVKLKSILDSKNSSELLPQQYYMIQEQLEVLKELISKGSNSVAALKAEPMAAAKMWGGSIEAYDSESEEFVEQWSRKKLEGCLRKILPKPLGKLSTLTAILPLDEETGMLSPQNIKIRSKIWETLLKLNVNKVSKKLKTETKYGVLDQFVRRAFADEDNQIETFNEKILEQASRDFKIVPLEKFSVSLSYMYTNFGLEDSIQDVQKELQRAVYKIYDSPITVEIKADILSAYVKKIAYAVNCSEDIGGLTMMNSEAKKAKLTSGFMKKILNSSGMDKDDDDYITVMDFAKGLNVGTKKKGLNKSYESQPQD